MSPQQIAELLQRYLDNQCTEEEAALVESWYQNLKDPTIPQPDPATSEILKQRLWSSVSPPAPTRQSTSLYLKIAASLIFLALTAVFVYQRVDSESKSIPDSSIDSQQIAIVKSGDENVEVLLPDESIVDLHPNSELRYPHKFQNDREVYLVGEALFKVARDEKHPFLVYANEVTTRVLGTSFLIKAYTDSKDITVAVKTGKVSVYAKQKQSNDRKEEIILTPNQQVIYDRDENQVTRMLVEHPQVVAPQTIQPTPYTTVPVITIFGQLQKQYGIEIQYDKKALSSCMLTYTDLAEEGLYEQMDIICNAIGVRYEKSESSIIIQGEGCK